MRCKSLPTLFSYMWTLKKSSINDNDDNDEQNEAANEREKKEWKYKMKLKNVLWRIQLNIMDITRVHVQDSRII